MQLAAGQGRSRFSLGSDGTTMGGRDHPPWIAGTIRISGADFSNWRMGVDRPGPSRRNARRPAVKCSANAASAVDDRFGAILVPLGQSQVAMSRLEQP